MGINVYIISYFLIFMWGVVEIFIIMWMIRTKPKKNIINKYPKKVIFLSLLPFGSSWKKGIEDKDIKIFEKYQYIIRIGYLSVLFPLFLKFYLYSKFFREFDDIHKSIKELTAKIRGLKN